MEISEKGVNLIAKFEGFSAYPYEDVGGVCTIGYGLTHYPNGRAVRCSDPHITKSDGVAMFRAELESHYVPRVSHCVKPNTTQAQFDAMVSLAYNIGIGAFRKSTMLKYHNLGRFDAAADEFLKWDRVEHKVVKGLLLRREKERDLYIS